MRLSCKISNSILNFLETRGEDTSALLESTDLPIEFLRDSSYWMQAVDMEAFLALSVRLYQKNDGNLLEKMAHAVPEQRSWGLLDSVLRMVPKPQEIFAQPERFLSYFVSPAPPVVNISRSTHGVEFELPISSEQYPLITEYLKYTFETLPVFIGQPMAECVWQGIRVQISWQSEQNTMFIEDVGHQISPELLRQVVATLENTQRELQQRNMELQARNAEAVSASRINLVHDKDTANMLFQLRNNFSKLSDYMVRAQQLITLLVGQDRMNSGVKEAMRRVNWEAVIQQFPQLVSESQNLLYSVANPNLKARARLKEEKPNQEPLSV